MGPAKASVMAPGLDDENSWFTKPNAGGPDADAGLTKSGTSELSMACLLKPKDAIVRTPTGPSSCSCRERLPCCSPTLRV